MRQGGDLTASSLRTLSRSWCRGKPLGRHSEKGGSVVNIVCSHCLTRSQVSENYVDQTIEALSAVEAEGVPYTTAVEVLTGLHVECPCCFSTTVFEGRFTIPLEIVYNEDHTDGYTPALTRKELGL